MDLDIVWLFTSFIFDFRHSFGFRVTGWFHNGLFGIGRFWLLCFAHGNRVSRISRVDKS